jgi:hypothetical protein
MCCSRAALLALSACVKSADILPAGPETYLLTKSVGGLLRGWTAAQRICAK